MTRTGAEHDVVERWLNPCWTARASEEGPGHRQAVLRGARRPLLRLEGGHRLPVPVVVDVDVARFRRR